MSSPIRLRLAWLLLGLLFLARPGFADQVEPDTWIISGQANACGWAPGKGMPPHPGVTMFDAGQWVEAVEPLKVLGGQGVGPWLTAAVICARAKQPIRLAGYASPDREIAYWDAVKPGWHRLSAHIKEAGMGAGVFLWYQGENDASANTAPDVYQRKLADLVARVRTQAGNPRMLAVIVQLAAYWPAYKPEGDEIREAQRQFVIADGNALLVTALGMHCDGTHLNREGYYKLGLGIGAALLRHRYKGKDTSWPGPVLDVVRPGKDDTSLVAHFAEVRKLANANTGEFQAIDASGGVGCKSIVLQNTRAVLTFARALKPPIRLRCGTGSTYTPSLVDEAGHPAPAVTLEVVAGPVPEDKETACPNGAGQAPAKPATP
jgi:hypothetical protein